MAECEGNRQKSEDTEHDKPVGDDDTDSYQHTAGYIYVVRKIDQTGYPTDKYRIEVSPEKRAKTRLGKRLQQVFEKSVTDMNKAERDLRKEFDDAYDKCNEIGWYTAGSQDEVISECQEVLSNEKINSRQMTLRLIKLKVC